MRLTFTSTMVGIIFSCLSTSSYCQWSWVAFSGEQEVLATADYIFTQNDAGFFVRSNDGGISWTPIVTIPNGGLVKGKDNSLFYYNHHLLLRSVNQGTTWDTIPTGLTDVEYGEPTDPFFYYFYDDINYVVPLNGAVVLRVAHTNNYDAPAYYDQYKVITFTGAHVSSFSLFAEPLCYYPDQLYEPKVYSDGVALYGPYLGDDDCDLDPDFLAVSTNQGATWTYYPFASLLPVNYEFTRFLDDGVNVYLQANSTVTARYRIYRLSPDGSLEELNEVYTLPREPITAFANINGILMAAFPSGRVYDSEDNGETWSITDRPGFVINSLAAVNTYLFAGTPDGVYRQGYTAPVHIASFTLVDADSDSDISVLLNGDTIILDRSLNIRANIAGGTVDRVSFYLNGKLRRHENKVPFALAGDNNGDYFTWNVQPGEYEIRAVAQKKSNGGFEEVSVYVLNVVVTDPDNIPSNAPARALAFNARIVGTQVQEELLISVDQYEVSDCMVYIYGVDGKEYFQGKLSINDQQIRLELNNLNLIPGMYMVRLQSNQDTDLLKFIKE